MLLSWRLLQALFFCLADFTRSLHSQAGYCLFTREIYKGYFILLIKVLE